MRRFPVGAAMAVFLFFSLAVMQACGPSWGYDPLPTPHDTEEIPVGSGVTMMVVRIPPGTFAMGTASEADPQFSNSRPVHDVIIGEAFYIGLYEVTQAEYEAVMGENPSEFVDPTKPVDSVSWYNAVGFCERLSASSGYIVRLPTEAEWEYVCRSEEWDVDQLFPFGDDLTLLADYAWYADNSGDETHPVGEKLPNSLGVYDLSGNVLEWVQDWYGEYGSELQTDPTGPAEGTARVLRGGNFLRPALEASCPRRHADAPNASAYLYGGFRVVIQDF